jgi:FkbM family methyltransferase
MKKTISLLGNEFLVEPNPEDFWGWVSEGKFDSEWRLLAKHLRPEHTFLDLGAWIGAYSLFASTIAKNVIAVEPDPVAYEILERNVSSRKRSYLLGGRRYALFEENIDPVRLAITTGEPDVITLGSGLLGASTTRANRNAGGGIGAWEAGQQFDVECMGLRAFAETWDICGDPLFIKMDVEGSEEMILKELDFFKDNKPILYLETHPFWWKDERACWENIRRLAGLYKHTWTETADIKPRTLLFYN